MTLMNSHSPEAIVLAGGFGTRLQAVVSDVPKPLAPIAGVPFLHYILKNLSTAGFKRAVLSTGYKADLISETYGHKFLDLEIRYAVETSPLGTGGGIRNALDHTTAKLLFVLNGDSFFDVDFAKMWDFHQQKKAKITLALSNLQNCARYGRVETSADGQVTKFAEKGVAGEGWINAGVYIFSRDLLTRFPKGQAFSLEKDVLAANPSHIYGYQSPSYFIDIGVPEDYIRAQTELPKGYGLTF